MHHHLADVVIINRWVSSDEITMVRNQFDINETRGKDGGIATNISSDTSSRLTMLSYYSDCFNILNFCKAPGTKPYAAKPPTSNLQTTSQFSLSHPPPSQKKRQKEKQKENTFWLHLIGQIVFKQCRDWVTAWHCAHERPPNFIKESERLLLRFPSETSWSLSSWRSIH